MFTMNHHALVLVVLKSPLFSPTPHLQQQLHLRLHQRKQRQDEGQKLLRRHEDSFAPREATENLAQLAKMVSLDGVAFQSETRE
jgi:hypothetical protein